MGVPISQMWTVASYVIGQKLKGRKQYPLVLMLEPLLRCNLACAGCGKIQYPGHILKKEMTVEEALAAVDECGAPIVSIPGGEPLMHTQIGELVRQLIARKKYIYLCTNALLLKEKLEAGLFKPSKYLTFSVHMDGDPEAHDFSVCREGTYEKAEEAIRLAVKMGFRVTCNTTLFNHVDTARTRAFFDRMMEVGLEGIMVSPGYSYSKAPDQESFLNRQQTVDMFRALLKNPKKTWKFNLSPLFLEFLAGGRYFECTPWGNPCYTLFGWQKPCYLLQEGYAKSYAELLRETEWANYGRVSGNPKCQQCMVHCGYEPTAVDLTFGSWSGFWGTVKATLFGVDSAKLKKVTPPTPRRWVAKPAAQDPLAQPLQEALDFRGDALMELADGSQVTGYVFNVTSELIEYYPQNGGPATRLPRHTLRRISNTGRDFADGKSWESWVKKYEEKKKNAVGV